MVHLTTPRQENARHVSLGFVAGLLHRLVEFETDLFDRVIHLEPVDLRQRLDRLELHVGRHLGQVLLHRLLDVNLNHSHDVGVVGLLYLIHLLLFYVHTTTRDFSSQF